MGRGVFESGRTRDALLWLFHRNLAFVLGNRVLYLAHQGRLTGLRYETVLPLARLSPDSGEAIVIAPRGLRAEWTRDLRAGRALEIRVRHLRLPEPEHRFLLPEECRSLLVEFQASHPLTWRLLARTVGLPEDPKNADLTAVRAVAFRPRPLPDRET